MTAPFSDRFQRNVTYLRLSVTDRCNYRCTYCVPVDGVALGPSTALLSFEEIEILVAAMARVGVNRVRLTGGEPLSRRQLPLLISKLSTIEGVDEVLMTTNAHALETCVDELAGAGLAGVNISLDTIRPDRFRQITRGGNLERVLRGLRAAKRAGFGTVKINAVVILGFNDDEILELTRFAVDEGVVLRFIEFMPVGVDTVWHRNSWLPAAEIKRVLAREYTMAPGPHQPGIGPARYWRLHGKGMPPEGGVVGIIAAMSEGFCDSCNRVRLTAQGGLRVCLADDNEVDLRAVVRSGGGEPEILKAVQQALYRKNESHHFHEPGANGANKEMVKIGG